jgi:tetratricopeptide (TPR) repeat protein
MPENISEGDMSRAEQEEVVEVAKDFEVVPLPSDLVWRAKVALFDTRVSECEGMMRPHCANNLWGAALYAEAAMWRFIFERKPEDFETAVQRMKTSAAMSVVLQKRFRGRTDKKSLAKEGAPAAARAYLEALAMEAQAHLYVALLHMIQKSFLKGALFVRKSWKVWETTNAVLADLEAAGEEVPADVRGLVCFGVGFFFFFISLVPSHLQFIVKVLGFQGDRGRAVALLSRAKDLPESGKSVESSLIMYIMYYWFLDERAQAPVVLEQLRTALPQSPIIYLAAGWAALVTEHNVDAALDCYRRASEMTELEQLRVACRGQLAYALYMREDWEASIAEFSLFMDVAASAESKCYSAFAMGVSCFMLGRTPECAAHFKKCIEFEDKTSNWDVFAVSVARSFLAHNTFDRCTLLFVLIENANESGRAAKALEYCDEVERLAKWENFSMDDKTALLSYYRGCALRLLGETDKAKSALIKAAGLHAKPLALEARRAVPYALLVLGEISMWELGQLDAADRFLKKAEAYKEKYLFMDSLSFRLKSNIEILHSKRAKEAAKEGVKE